MSLGHTRMLTVNIVIDVNRNQFVRLATWSHALPMSSAASVLHRVRYLSDRTIFGTIS